MKEKALKNFLFKCVKNKERQIKETYASKQKSPIKQQYNNFHDINRSDT